MTMHGVSMSDQIQSDWSSSKSTVDMNGKMPIKCGYILWEMCGNPWGAYLLCNNANGGDINLENEGGHY
jgi:hypothetical protein